VVLPRGKRLEVELQAKLDDARLAADAGDLAEGSIRLFERPISLLGKGRRRTRITGLQMVEGVDEVCAEAQPQIFAPPEVSDQRDVPVIHSRTNDHPAPGGAERRGRQEVWVYQGAFRLQLVFVDISGIGRWRLSNQGLSDLEAAIRRKLAGNKS